MHTDDAQTRENALGELRGALSRKYWYCTPRGKQQDTTAPRVLIQQHIHQTEQS